MISSKNINKICVFVLLIAVLVTVLFMNGSALGLTEAGAISFSYEDKLFDDSYVHTLNIEMDDWDSFIETATSEEYSTANVTIDGETIYNVGIRGKGNTSLSTVSQLDSERYSLKIEFDAYEDSNNYYGLDKLCLNNLIQDYTMMKDYLAYKLMGEFGASAPLVSFVYVTVNGEDWGLFLAVEAVEDSFLERNYGSNFGDLYKPDTMSMGGGRGNGRDFDMDDFDFDFGKKDTETESEDTESKDSESKDSESEKKGPGSFAKGPDFSGGGPDFNSEEGGFPGGGPDFDSKDGGFPGGGMPFGFGNNDAKLIYSDDDYDSYSTIFNSAKTPISTSDKNRLISALKSLNEGIENGDTEEITSAVNVEEAMRYMVVHNFLVNGDSYTGSMIHNYYLYEEDGQLSMIPWDYNLAYGTFQASDSTSAINDPIDTPLQVTEDSTDRPMFSWITSSDEYLEMYHEYYQEFLDQFYTNGYLTDLIDSTYNMIRDYVDKDPTKFCTTEEFDTAVETMQQFVSLRCKSIQGQLDGTIPSTDAGQEADSSSLIDASGITLSDMGSMGGGGGPGGFPGGDFSGGNGGPGGFPGGNNNSSDSESGSRHSGRGGGPGGHGNRSESSDKSTSDSETTNSESSEGFPSDFPGGDFEGGFPGGDFPGGDFSGGGFPGGDFPDASSTVSTEGYIYLGVSAGVLLLALVFAALFKRRRGVH
ncbi:spore coat protein CotH [Butyrivibrio sp. CB08]|uniref:CotH kinase family protein n=1 Tax=Butyrivibrio sp. CB08 TaxID=2364879 RepID=UPI000EA87475|nr:CotH kinase family protein [Butyrivibrio sp. CB08]RKM62008.1 spore coat protein CotH [Butyrivibrio sp. CB08]